MALMGGGGGVGGGVMHSYQYGTHAREGSINYNWHYIKVRVVLKTTEGTVFPNTDRPRPVNNVFIFFFHRVLCKQFLC